MNSHPTPQQMSLFSDEPPLPLLLFSLRPEWHRRFAEGSKSFEYRRRFFQGPFCAAIYVSGSTRAIAAYAEFGRPIVGRPDDIVELAGVTDEASGANLREYFGHNAQVMALPVIRYRVMAPLTLSEIKRNVPNFQPPQSYAYLDRNRSLLEYLCRHAQWKEVVQSCLH